MPDRTLLAQVELAVGGVRITCYDDSLKDQIRDIFSMPPHTPGPYRPSHRGYYPSDEVVEPFTGEFFEEVLYLLPRNGLHGVLK